MKSFILSLFFVLGSLTTMASGEQESFYPSHCSNFGDEVSYSFTSCVNSNFRSLGYELPRVFLSHCSNYGPDLSYNFESCVSRNFRNIERELGMFLSLCFNSGGGVSYSFISCINRNMNDISYELRRQQ